jgi:hypothetical protein
MLNIDLSISCLEIAFLSAKETAQAIKRTDGPLEYKLFSLLKADSTRAFTSQFGLRVNGSLVMCNLYGFLHILRSCAPVSASRFQIASMNREFW